MNGQQRGSAKYVCVWKRFVQHGVTHNSSLALGIVGGLLVGALILGLTGTNPLKAYYVLLKETWGSSWGIQQTIQKFIPLSLVGLGLSIAFRSKVFNIGGEGQIYAGGIVGGLVAIYLGFLPPVVMLPLMFTAAFAGGVAWVLLPALLRAFYRVDEVITTLMLNYVGFWLVDFLVRGPITDPVTPGLEQSRPFSAASRLPIIIPNTRINLGLLVVLVSAAMVYILLWRTRWGYEFRAIGINPEAAAYGGISLTKCSFVPLLLSGGFAGLAGIIECAGVHGHLIAGFSPGYGYTAIAVALLGRLQPIGILLSGLFFATLAVGGDALQYDMGVPAYLSMVIQAVIVILVICVETVRLGRKNA